MLIFLSTGTFLDTMLSTVNKWSCERDPITVNCKIFETEALYDLSCKTTAYNWIKSKPQLLTEEINPNERRIYISSSNGGSVTHLSAKVFTKNFKSFDKFKTSFFSIYRIVLCLNDWKLSSCTCPFFLKNFKCKHIFAIAVSNNLAVFPPTAKNVPLGLKRKRGRPKGSTKALLKM